MMDYEQKIFNAVRPAVINLLAPDGFRNTYVRSATNLPVMSLMEMDNRTVTDRRSNSPGDDLAIIVYEAQMYAMTRKECRAIFLALDEKMMQLGFNRFSGTYVPNREDTNIFRYVARYEAMIDPNGVIYRRR